MFQKLTNAYFSSSNDQYIDVDFEDEKYVHALYQASLIVYDKGNTTRIKFAKLA